MQMKAIEKKTCDDAGASCPEVPELKRLRYFYGQMLGVNDFQTEQNYFREKLKLQNRCLHGYGTVCGLMVVPEPRGHECVPRTDTDRTEVDESLKSLLAQIEQAKANIAALERKKAAAAGNTAETAAIDAEINRETKKLADLEAQAEALRRKLDELPKGQGECREEEPTRVWIECGFALDCEGNEIVVRRPLPVDLWQYLSADDRKRVTGGATTLYLSICYCEQPVDPVRPVLADACGASDECTYGKLRDAVKIRVAVERPASDLRCEPCCTPCEDACLLLARIDRYQKGRQLEPGDIDNGVRRLISLYSPTTITGISWAHGATYSDTEAAEILGSDDGSPGLKVRFSRPVLRECLTDGVVDVWVIQGGPQRHGDIYNLDGVLTFEGLDHPTKDTVTGFRFRCAGGEDLDDGDRVLIVIRCAFILDACCRPVDGTHVGGRVPMLKDEEFRNRDRNAPRQACVAPPGGYGPWTSGSGAPGVTFESWFYVQHKTPAKAPRIQEDKK